MMKSAVFLGLVSCAAANVVFSRTVSGLPSGASGTVTLAPAGTCTGSDMYGSNDCTLNWGTNYTAAYDVDLTVALDNSTKINVDVTVDGLLPLKFSCVACGAPCTFKIPVIGKSVTIPAQACPLVPASGTKGSITLPLPAKSPVPLKTSVKGSASITGASGTIVTVDIDASLSP